MTNVSNTTELNAEPSSQKLKELTDYCKKNKIY